jgi:Domain of unknown function (DUF4326)
MAQTEVVNIYKIEEDWYGKEDTAYIGRGSIRRGLDGTFGNPFAGFGREENIRRFEQWFLKRCAVDEEYRAKVRTLAGKRLVCFCKPLACHGDVLVRYLTDSDRLDGTDSAKSQYP